LGKTDAGYVVVNTNRFVCHSRTKFGKAAAPDILRSLGVADESQLKIAGMLFFAKNISRFMRHAQMTAVAYKGTEKVYIYDRRDVRDDLLAQLNGAMAFLQRHLNIRSEIRGVNRHDIPELPLEALREAVVNALMHRDYSETGTQKIGKNRGQSACCDVPFFGKRRV